VNIWAGILDKETQIIGIYADFFQLGGHSLRATQLVAAIGRELNVRMPLVEVFRATTVSRQAEYVRERQNKTDGKNESDENIVLLKEGRKGKNLFLVHDGTGEVDGYVECCNQLNNDYNCWGIQAEKSGSYAPQLLTVERLAADYITKLRRIQPRGPYALAGWSLGGTIAFEMVRQLEEKNEPPAFFVMIDSPPPTPKTDETDKEFEFNANSELKFIQRYLGENEMFAKLEKMTDKEDIWTSIVEYLETNRYDEELIKNIIMRYEALQIPRGSGLSIGQLVKFMNMCRALGNARERYIPPNKIDTPTVHVIATESEEKMAVADWNNYTTRPLTIEKIDGDHYTIMRKPALEKLAGLLETELAERVG